MSKSSAGKLSTSLSSINEADKAKIISQTMASGLQNAFGHEFGPELNPEARAQIMQQLHELAPYMLEDSRVFIVIEKKPDSESQVTKTNALKKLNAKKVKHKISSEDLNNKAKEVYRFKLSLTGAGTRIESVAQSSDIIMASIEAKNKMIEYLDGVHKQLSAEASDQESLLPPGFVIQSLH